jgi:hypothetical protein
MTQSNRDIPMAPRERPMPHEGPPTQRDANSLYMYAVIPITAIVVMVVLALFLL